MSDFVNDLLLRALDKAPPVGRGSKRMSRSEASGTSGKEGQVYTQDPRAKAMASRDEFRYSPGEGEKDRSDFRQRGSRNRGMMRMPRPGPGKRSDFDSEGDGSSVLAPKPDWMGKMLEKMDPMARRAKAAIEQVEKAIASGDRATLSHMLEQAENAISMLKMDLNEADIIAKSVKTTPAADRFLGAIPQFDNQASDYNGTENAVALGVSRHGRDSGYFQPHRVI